MGFVGREEGVAALAVATLGGHVDSRRRRSRALAPDPARHGRAQARAAGAVVGDRARRARRLGPVPGQRARRRTRSRSTPPAPRTSAPARAGRSPASTRWRCCCWPPAARCAEASGRSGSSERRERGADAERPASRRATPRRRRAAPPSARSASPRAWRTCGCGCATRSAAGSAPAGCGRGRSGTRSRRGWSTRRRRARRRGCGRSAASPPGAPTAGRSGCCPAWGCCTCCARRTRAPTGRCATTSARCSAGTSRARTCWRARTCATAGRCWPASCSSRSACAWRARGCGASTRSAPALLLDFAPPGAPLEPRPPAGSAVDAELAFYPGATPLRALVAGETSGLDDAPGAFGTGGAQAALASAAAALAANPWLDEWPVALAAAVPDSRTTWTLSRRGRLAAARRRRARRWRLLALSGGRPVSVFGLWNGAALTPLAAGDGSRTVAL